MTRGAVWAIPLLLAAIASASAREPVPYGSSPDAMLSEIGSRGASATAIEFYNSSSWSPAMQQVEAGDRDWLLVALALSPGTDGAATTDLSLSISRALRTNPAAVLELFLTSSPPRFDLCRGWAEFAGHETFESAWAEVTAKIASLQVVKSPGLEAVRDKCIEKLRDSEGELRQIYSMMPE